MQLHVSKYQPLSLKKEKLLINTIVVMLSLINQIVLILELRERPY